MLSLSHTHVLFFLLSARQSRRRKRKGRRKGWRKDIPRKWAFKTLVRVWKRSQRKEKGDKKREPALRKREGCYLFSLTLNPLLSQSTPTSGVSFLLPSFLHATSFEMSARVCVWALVQWMVWQRDQVAHLFVGDHLLLAPSSSPSSFFSSTFLQKGRG